MGAFLAVIMCFDYWYILVRFSLLIRHALLAVTRVMSNNRRRRKFVSYDVIHAKCVADAVRELRGDNPLIQVRR